MTKVQKLIEFINDHELASIATLSDEFDIGISTVQRYLRYPEAKTAVTDCDGVYYANETKSPEPTSSIDVPIEELNAVLTAIIDVPKTQKRIVGETGIAASLVEATLSEQGLDIAVLDSLNGTKHYVLFSETPTATTLTFKGSVFKKDSTSNIWNELSEKYVRARTWETIDS